MFTCMYVCFAVSAAFAYNCILHIIAYNNCILLPIAYYYVLSTAYAKPMFSATECIQWPMCSAALPLEWLLHWSQAPLWGPPWGQGSKSSPGEMDHYAWRNFASLTLWADPWCEHSASLHKGLASLFAHDAEDQLFLVRCMGATWVYTNPHEQPPITNTTLGT